MQKQMSRTERTIEALPLSSEKKKINVIRSRSL